MELSDREYLERLFEAFYEVGALPGGGVTRLGYTALEDEMHRRFGALAEALGGTVETDLAGNSYAFLAPAEEYVLIGSHLDSVIQGGRYDGVAGVMAGLLLLKRTKETGLKLPLKVAAFRCEESSNFGCCTMGSGLVTGQLKEGPEKLSKLTGKDGSLLGDVFALYVGSAIGGPKFCPAVSPKKTIAGSVGGLAGSVIAAMIVFGLSHVFCEAPTLAKLPVWWHYLLLGFLGGIAGQIGDLFASLVKRHSGIKDFSNLFPGHGGMLDRLDSVLFMAVLMYCYLLFFRMPILTPIS